MYIKTWLQKLKLLCFASFFGMSFSLVSAAQPKIIYVTDLEGRKAGLESIVQKTPELTLSSDGILTLAPGPYIFVYGGDTMDRGADQIFILRALFRLKMSDHRRVILIQGNRDINKLRLKQETSPEALPIIPEKMLPWLEETKADTTARHSISGRMKFIFSKTMASPGAFEFWREELQKLSGKKLNDEEVASAVLKELRPTGLIYEYMNQSQLATIVGDTLIVHGSVTDENFGIIPGQKNHTDDVRVWVDELNQWGRRQFEEWALDKKREDGKRTADELILYQMPLVTHDRFEPGTEKPNEAKNSQSIVYGRYTDLEAQARLPSIALIKKLKAQGIRRIIVGHKPSGDLPLVMRFDDFEIIVADTSYRPNFDYASIGISAEKTEVIGSTIAGDEVKYSLPENQTVGKLTTDGYLIKGQTNDGRYILFRFGENHKYDEIIVPASQVDIAKLRAPLRSSDCAESIVQAAQ